MRFDLFTPIHKALRRSLFETAMNLGRTDFGSADETAAAERAVAECMHYLREHAEHEDRHVFPEVARLSPELGLIMASGHPELERAAIAIESLWPRLAALPPELVQLDARRAMGAELTRRFHAFVADELRHMDREERELNTLFWARLSDAEIMAVSGRIIASIPPERMRTWIALMLPTMTGPEREAAAARQAAATAAA